MDSGHVPVMLEETLLYLSPVPGGTYVDCTLGGGGHAESILARSSPGGRLIGFDRDPEALKRASERLHRFGSRFTAVHSNFVELRHRLEILGIGKVDGVLFDFGVSSMQLDKAERGFGYMVDAPLDMRMNPEDSLTAEMIVNEWPESEIARILRSYGEERWSSRIASFIVEARRRGRIKSTGQLVEIIKAAIPASARRGGPHPAKRTFQALRIAVNRELESIDLVLDQAVEVLKPGGRICAISFHSLEDRLVKRAFQRLSGKCTCPPGLPECRCGRSRLIRLLTPKPVTPAEPEVTRNPRSRSARLRAAERL